MKYSAIYFDSENQKIRFTKKLPEQMCLSYKYIGKATRVEFDLLIELLWFKYQDDNIPFEDLKNIFEELRFFCDNIKYNLIL